MNEHALTRAVLQDCEALQRAGAPLWFLKVHGNRYQRSGVGDTILCLAGHFCMIELKHPDEPAEPTPKQALELDAVRRAWGTALVENDRDRYRALVLKHLRDRADWTPPPDFRWTKPRARP